MSQRCHNRTRAASMVVFDDLVGARPMRPSLRPDGLRRERSRAVAQDLGQRVRKNCWLGELEDVSVGLGVSLFQWTSGGFEHPHDAPPYPLMPSPTFRAYLFVGRLAHE